MHLLDDMRVRCVLSALVLVGSAASATPPLRVFRVEVGHSLGVVAKRTGVSKEALAELNGLKSETLTWHSGLLVPDGPLTAQLPWYRPPVAAPAWRACGAVERAPTVKRNGCLCAAEACMCPTSDDEAEVVVGKARWKSLMWLGRIGDLDAFALARVDLDGDGVRETVVSSREGVGNGIAIELWRHIVVSRGQPIASFVSIDGAASFVEQPTGCALLAVRTMDRTDQLRGGGLYWVGQLHVLRESALAAVGPEVFRRYTFRFASQRWATVEQAQRDLVSWFQRDAILWPEPLTHPECWSAKVLREDEGTFVLEGHGPVGRRGWNDGVQSDGYDVLLDAATGAQRLEDYLPFDAPTRERTATVCNTTVDGEPWTTLAF